MRGILNAFQRHTGSAQQHRYVLSALFAAAFSLRVLAVVTVGEWQQPETWEYGDVADNILAGKGFSGTAWFVPEGPTAFMAPVYVYVLAAFQGLFGAYAWAILMLVQALLGAITAVLLFRVARHAFGIPAGYAAAAIFALNPTHIYVATQIHPLALLTLLFVAVLALVQHTASRRTIAAAVLLGAVTGLSMLTDPAIICFIPIILAWPAVTQATQWRRGLALSACTLAAAILVVSPWTLRNYLVMDHFIPVKSQAGFVLWVGNHPGATGTQTMLDSDGNVVNASHRMPEAWWDELREMGEPEAYNHLGREAVAYMLAHPADTVMRTARKALYFWWWPTWINDPRVAANPIMGQLYHPYKWVWAPMLVLFAIGLWRARGRWRRGSLLVLALLCYTGLYALTNVGSNPRYRIPVEPAVMAIAGAAAAGASREDHGKA